MAAAVVVATVVMVVAVVAAEVVVAVTEVAAEVVVVTRVAVNCSLTSLPAFLLSRLTLLWYDLQTCSAVCSSILQVTSPEKCITSLELELKR